MARKPTYEKLEQRVKELEKEAANRKETEEALSSTHRKLRAVFDAIQDNINVVDLDFNLTDVNEAIVKAFGLSDKERVLSRKCFSVLKGRKEICPNCAVAEAYRTKARVCRTSTPEDEVSTGGRNFEVFAYPIMDGDGNLTGAVEFARDVTERKRAEKALRESEEKLAGIIASVTDHMSIIDDKHNIVWANDIAKELFGPDLLGKKCYSSYHGYDKPCEPCVARKCFEDGKVHEHETVVTTRDGKQMIFWCVSSAAAWHRDGRPKLVVELSRNITNRKQAQEALLKAHNELECRVEERTAELLKANKQLKREIEERNRTEEALQESEEKFRTFMETASDLMHIADKDGNFTYLNESMAKTLGYSKEEMIGMHVTQVLAKEALEKRFKPKWEELITKGEISLETTWVTRNGKEIHGEIKVVAIYDTDGTYAGSRGVLRDVTERNQAIEEKMKVEAQLQEAQKVEAIATLAGGIAHEFNNALVGISGNIELLQMDLPDDKNIDKYVKRMNNSTLRMVNLTNQLLAYARGGKYQPKTVSLNDFVEGTVPLVKHSIDPAIRVDTDLPGDISRVEVDFTQMQMVLSAVLNNASEAMEGKGCIRIITRNENIDEEFAETDLGLKPGPYVCLTIEDEGKGMDEETRSRVFDPFFTTKFQGRGLGMAAVYGIIKNHGGSISVDSELGKGTAVRIYLPAIASAEARQAGLPAVEVHVERAKESKSEVTTGTGTILLIEDEDVVIDVMRPILERMGYRILLAKTGAKAVDIARTFDGDIDLAILDIALPDMKGGQVYPVIMQARPNLKVIVCSGYTLDGPGQEILDAGAQDYIQKPFSLETLSRKLNEVLGGQIGN